MALVIGVDEVGRGPVAGPVVTAGVLVRLPHGGSWPVVGVRDSKKLTPAKRAILSDQLVQSNAIRYVIHESPAHEIDRNGILATLGKSFRYCIQTLLATFEAQKGWVPEGERVVEVQIDGKPLWSDAFLSGAGGPPVRFVVGGDDREWAIGAASIIAKVYRDEQMRKFAEYHPGYGWEKNMGYETAEHAEAIKRLGLSNMHRRTFCSKYLEEQEDDAFQLFSTG